MIEAYFAWASGAIQRKPATTAATTQPAPPSPAHCRQRVKPCTIEPPTPQEDTERFFFKEIKKSWNPCLRFLRLIFTTDEDGDDRAVERDRRRTYAGRRRETASIFGTSSDRRGGSIAGRLRAAGIELVPAVPQRRLVQLAQWRRHPPVLPGGEPRPLPPGLQRDLGRAGTRLRDHRRA